MFLQHQFEFRYLFFSPILNQEDNFHLIFLVKVFSAIDPWFMRLLSEDQFVIYHLKFSLDNSNNCKKTSGGICVALNHINVPYWFTGAGMKVEIEGEFVIYA